jgi:hypothetical protein
MVIMAIVFGLFFLRAARNIYKEINTQPNGRPHPIKEILSTSYFLFNIVLLILSFFLMVISSVFMFLQRQ